MDKNNLPFDDGHLGGGYCIARRLKQVLPGVWKDEPEFTGAWHNPIYWRVMRAGGMQQCELF